MFLPGALDAAAKTLEEPLTRRHVSLLVRSHVIEAGAQGSE
jgi:hypothetical protein